jgi:hypothetical protein
MTATRTVIETAMAAAFVVTCTVAAADGAGGTGAGEYFPFRQPTVQEFFKPLENHTGELPWTNQYTPKAEIVRVTNVTKEDFFELIRSGQPFAVDDGARDWPYKDWPCSKFGESWPQGKMKAEYSEGQAYSNLGDGKWWNTPRKGDQQEQVNQRLPHITL